MKYTSFNNNRLRQLKTAIETLPIQQKKFLFWWGSDEKKRRTMQVVFSAQTRRGRCISGKLNARAHQTFRSSGMLHDEATESKNVNFEIWDCRAVRL